MSETLHAKKMRTVKQNRKQEQGQTLVIALLILGVLLILGAVFAGILSRTIKTTSFAKTRSLNNDFAIAGVRFAHSQLVNSDKGADWRGNQTQMVLIAADQTIDPDAMYLRGPATSGEVSLLFQGTNRMDQGGPDGLGPFFRINYRGGRALVRVRYAPGDPSIFSTSVPGAIRDTGLARNYIIIESVGRQGEVLANDPTQAQARGAVRISNYADQASFLAEFARMKSFDEKELSSKKLVAFAQIGLIDYARFITNKYKTTRPVELGWPTRSGATYRETGGVPANVVSVPVELGSNYQLLNANNTLGIFPGGGSMRINNDVRLHGTLSLSLNQSLGEAMLLSGAIGFDDPNARLLITRTRKDAGTQTFVTDPTQSMVIDSSATNFNTLDGTYRDGFEGTDQNNQPRGVRYLTPPTIMGSVDSVEGSATSRYIRNTRESGSILASGNSGQFGHGSGVYVDNLSDFQVPDDDAGRRTAGGNASLVQDWLSPYGEGVTFRSGWHGPFYIPVGAFLHLDTDGFTISRNAHPDQNPSERTFRRADGSDSGLSSIRYRVGLGTDGLVHIVNALTPGVAGNVNGTLTPEDYVLGPIFNGVLCFEGNVRMRGVIPTDVQLTVVSNKTVYIEGNIVKGVETNDVTTGVTANNSRITRKSKSSLMIMAKDYVTLNPTMFFGPDSERNAQVEIGGQGVGGYNPLKIGAPDGGVNLVFDQPLSAANPNDPSTLLTTPDTWLPSYMTYFEMDRSAPASAIGSGVRVRPNLILTQALEYTNPGPSNTFYNMFVNRGGVSSVAQSEYFFETLGSSTNSAQFIWASVNPPGPGFERIYGLGTESFQQSPKFESNEIPLFSPASANINFATRSLSSDFNNNSFSLKMMDSNSIELNLTQFGTQPSGNYLLARSIVTPSNIKVEASIFAEEGCFFVIPGDWFNPNPNDRRDVYEDRVLNLTPTFGLTNARNAAATERRNNFGSGPFTPFYGESPDVRIEIVGSVSENMPPPIAQQAEWLKKWGWIPTKTPSAFNATTGQLRNIPYSHLTPTSRNLFASSPDNFFWTPNLTITYDDVLATGRVDGFATDTSLNTLNPDNPASYVRSEVINGVIYPMPPMPRLPVSPALAYFGEVNR
jgi:Tfp pilus assembly protein PilX